MTVRTLRITALAAASLLALSCGESSQATSAPGAAVAPRATLTVTPRAPAAPAAARARVRGAVVRFSARGVHVDVTIRSDSPTTRDLLARLPLRIDLEELSGREKIAYLSPGLRTKGSPGSDPKDGDLIYYRPWGNLGFYYDAAGIGYSDETINLGTYRATRRQLDRLQGRGVTVRVLRR
ncbi:hypothetical protein DSM112329_05303 [Paraconexibacter sp. AEG42_29]|uniref:Cyclophilin-like domain-containing protein n=1 Tax=Paraconexibacter sp. AEG42_29 TaxID=2997339 RepID=A0AAU7B3F0_9ACTN